MYVNLKGRSTSEFVSEVDRPFWLQVKRFVLPIIFDTRLDS